MAARNGAPVRRLFGGSTTDIPFIRFLFDITKRAFVRHLLGRVCPPTCPLKRSEGGSDFGVGGSQARLFGAAQQHDLH
ncbi:MAG: hypothetical protein V1799_15160 [bacterium]